MPYYHYSYEGIKVIRVAAKRRPSEKGSPWPWVVEELKEDGWHMPGTPETTWGTLKNLEFLGTLPDNRFKT